MYWQETKSGRYQFFERYKDPYTGKWRAASVTLDGCRKSDQKAAQERLRAIVRARVQNYAPQVDTMRVGELCDRYVSHQYATRKEQTAVCAGYRIAKIRDMLGADVKVAKLTAPYVREKIGGKGYNERLKYYKAMMRWAYKSDLVRDISYLDKLEREKADTARVRNAEKFLEREEIQKLLEGMVQPDWKLLTRFLILSGLRIGEAIALTDADVDFEQREISVNKTFSMILWKVSESPKTETSNRTVYMQDELLEVATEIEKRKAGLKERFGIRTDLFFPTVDGRPITYDVYEKYFRENTERLLGRRLTAHALRHTHVAMLAEAGIPLEVISRRLGHADSKVTKEVYFHVTERMKERDRNLLKNVKIT